VVIAVVGLVINIVMSVMMATISKSPSLEREESSFLMVWYGSCLINKLKVIRQIII
jgi:hypothetical protein